MVHGLDVLYPCFRQCQFAHEQWNKHLKKLQQISIQDKDGFRILFFGQERLMDMWLFGFSKMYNQSTYTKGISNNWNRAHIRWTGNLVGENKCDTYDLALHKNTLRSLQSYVYRSLFSLGAVVRSFLRVEQRAWLGAIMSSSTSPPQYLHVHLCTKLYS